MIASFKQWLEGLAAPQAASTAPEHALQVATAALLAETMRMDYEVGEDEREAALSALERQFSLSRAEVDALLELAREEARGAPGYHQFTSLINRHFSPAQKARLIGYMWQVAFADGHLDDQEHHLIRKVADLLYVPHAEFIAAKLRAREAVEETARR